MSLQTKFEQFRQNIEPTPSQMEQVIGSHTHLRQNILQKLPYVKNTILTGSYKRRTLIRPLNDVDVFVILNYTAGAYGNPTPQSILTKLKQDLANSYPNSTIKQDKPCIVLDFSHCKFELTPSIEAATWGTSYYEIPNVSNTGLWQRVDSPDVLGERLSQANKQTPLLIPLIKMMKRCKEKNNLKNLRSFEMELLAIQKLGFVNTYREGVTRLLDIYGWLGNADLYNLKLKNDLEFANYCRSTLFGTDFPLND